MLSVDTSIIAAQTVTFLIAVALLWRIVLGPASKRLTERADRIEGDLRRAEKLRHDMDRLKTEHDIQLAEVSNQAREMINQAVHEGQKTRNDILDDARRQSAEIVAHGREQLNMEKTRVVREMRAQIVDLSVLMAEKLLQSAMTPAIQKQLADEALRNLDTSR